MDGDLMGTGLWGFWSTSLAQGEKQTQVDFYPLTIGAILGTVGARAISLYGLFVIVIAGYESFSYDKSVLKSFYKEDSMKNHEDAQNTASDDYRGQMRNQTLLTTQFSMNYFTFLALRFMNTFCCCCNKYFDKEGSWYRRENTRLKRLKVAKAKLQ